MIFKLLGTKPTESIYIGRKNDDGSYTPLNKNAIAGRIVSAKLKDFEYKGEKGMALDIRFSIKIKLISLIAESQRLLSLLQTVYSVHHKMNLKTFISPYTTQRKLDTTQSLVVIS